MGTNYKGQIPKIPGIEMPDNIIFGGLFKEIEISMEKARIEMEQYEQKMLDSGNMREYTDESGFYVREITAEDKSFKIMTKGRYLNGEYERRFTIWKDGKIIRDDVEKSSITTSDLHKKSGGGCPVALVVIVLIAIAMVLIITTII